MRVFIGLVCALLTACSDHHSELKKYILNVKQSKPMTLGPIPEFPTVPRFSFPNSRHLRNPFLLEDQQGVRKKQVLETYTLESLQLVGFINDEKSAMAFIKQPDGQVFLVKEGDYLGKNKGRVRQIGKGSIEVEEIIKGQEKHRVTLSLSLENIIAL